MSQDNPLAGFGPNEWIVEDMYQRYLADPATGPERVAEVKELLIKLDQELTLLTIRVVPRGADAVVMVEHTDTCKRDGATCIEVRRPATAGQFISYAGSDLARGETVLPAGQLGQNHRAVIGQFADPQHQDSPVSKWDYFSPD